MVNLAASENQVAIVHYPRGTTAIRASGANSPGGGPTTDLTAFRSAIRIMEGLIEDDAPLSDLATADLAFCIASLA